MTASCLGETEGTSFIDNNRQPNRLYRYELIAINSAGLSSVPAVINETGGGGNSDVFEPNSSDIEDVDAFYDQDGYETVDVIRLDVRTNTTPGICTIDDLSGCTLADVIADVDGDDDFKVDIAVHLSGADFPEDGTESNAELRQRGGTSRLGPQKSFRIKLDSKDVLWRNERRLQLNKHPNERARVRNKLSFDLLRELPHLPSLRTQFVNLWIDDGKGPEDYGLFTHVEFAGKEYLVNRGRNEDDNLYKIEFFEFSQGDLDNIQVDDNGEPLDEDRFESRLGIQRGDDHRKVVEMLTAMNDPNQSFESVFNRYFNRNNVLTWITANLLLHATDAITHNFYLYNPIGSDKFYFLPWDYDSTFHPENELTNSYDNDALSKRLFYGYARGINSKFVSQFYRLPGIHQEIIAAADVLRNNYLTDSNIAERAARYAEVVEPYLSRSPDIDHNPKYVNSTVDFAAYVASIHNAMRTAFDIPMPTILREPTLNGDKLLFSWEPAYDVTQTNQLDYDLEVSTSVSFEPDNIVLSVEDIPDASNLVSYEADASILPSGKLYFRVTARGNLDPTRVWQVSDNTVKINGETWFGVEEFVLP